ncbi:iron dicitrate transport regulator FecR [Pedobacter sp. KBW06]|uniref:FecR family protein n=1 Tax=Pedobacter sp. KBW06 TaxID=2153359 RepID=UPI000F5B1BF2|nr:FecR domain-containing protein [Pedobacter sp. KBW06]RQO74465.1 iron dicitrate transport regulator FecR [Pedobacter sp. KBW06]
MQKTELISIAARVSEGTASEQELALYLYHLNGYVKEFPVWEEVPQSLQEELQDQQRLAIFNAIDKTPAIQVKRTLHLWPGIAAAVVLLLLGFLYFNRSADPELSREKRTVHLPDIAPGQNGASLQLAEGKLIDLSSVKTGISIDPSKLSYNDGSAVIPHTSSSVLTGDLAGKHVQMITGRGQTYSVSLSDGTKVWLNAGSKLDFPVVFAKKGQRIVELSGEAYFQVAKDNSRPFLVRSNAQQVIVLGTHFNVSAYKNEKLMKTTLLEGSVKILAGEHARMLKPGEQARISDQHMEIIENIDLDEVVAWKNGYFKFNENLEEIMNKISRWYNVDVEYQIKPDPRLVFSGRISRKRNVSGILKMLEYNGDVHFKIEGRKIIVTK